MSTPHIGRKHYGKIPLTVAGKAAWDAQDARQTWSDAGEVRAAIEPIVAKLEEIVARNATLGASEYLSSGEGALSIDGSGEIVVGVRIWNDAAALIAHVPLKTLVVAALQELRPHLGVDKDAQAILSQLIGLGRQLAQLGAPAAPKARPQLQAQEA